MSAILTTVFVIMLSLLVTRVAATALVLTGLSEEAARFQARSALTGTGFTTSEAEWVVNHPVRRRIIMLLMLVGRAGIVSVMAGVTVSFAGAESAGGTLSRFAVLVAAGVLMFLFVRSNAPNRMLSRTIERALRRYTHLKSRDYAGLLHLSGDYGVAEVGVQADDWVAGRTLRELRLREQGIVVLGIERLDGTFEGAPKGTSVAEPGDTLVVYGSDSAIQAVDSRS